ncbi:MAG: LysM peptidoglycan-binding domain-containing protein [Cellulosilyticaceae bacterium]
MGKIVYEPKKNEEISQQETTGEAKAEARYHSLIESIDSVRPVGDTQCEYGVYLEDYAYTYTYQFAATDLGSEHSGVLLGEYYNETKEMIICGMMPISPSELTDGSDWINEEAVERIVAQKDKYFPGTKVLGWFHMQPGYGTMLTMKEVKIHRELFDYEGTLLLLVDPINKIETFYVYEEGTLKEQTGYFLYYDKNPSMQQYMLDNPFVESQKEEADDTAVHQFREIGKIRKKEYQQRKRTNFTVVAASIAILALGAVVIKMSDQNKLIASMQSQLESQSVQASSGAVTEGDSNGLSEDQVQFIINGDDQKAEGETAETTDETAQTEETSEAGVTVVDNTKVNLTPNQEEETDTDEVVKEETTQNQEEVAKAEEVVKEEAPEVKKEEVKKEEQTAKVETEEEPEGNYLSYTVQEGDTLRKISYDHYKTEKRTKDIIKLNDLENGDEIYVGQNLKLPEK